MNTKHKKYKDFNRLQIKSAENSIDQGNLGYKELDEPYVRGYDIEYILRADIARREDAWVFQYIIDNLTTTSWSRRKDGTYYDSGLRRDVEIHPEKWTVTDRGYDRLKPQIQKYLKKDEWWVAPKEHLNYFNFESLSELIIRNEFNIIKKQSTFPLEMFLLMGFDYVNDPDMGLKKHQERMKFEKNMSDLQGQK